MKKTVNHYVTDSLIASNDDWKYFDEQLRLWLKDSGSSKDRYKNHSSKWPLSGSWEYQFACSYLDKAERLLKEKNLIKGIKNISELRAMFNKYDNLKTFLLSLRIAAMTFRAGLIPQGVVAGKKYSNTQKVNRGNRKTWNNLTKEQMAERNQKIADHCNRTRLKPSSFAKRHAAEYGLKPRRIKEILKEALGTLPG